LHFHFKPVSWRVHKKNGPDLASLLATASRRENRGAERDTVAPAALVPQERSRECGVNKTISAGGGRGRLHPLDPRHFPSSSGRTRDGGDRLQPRDLREASSSSSSRGGLRTSIGAEAFRLRSRSSRGHQRRSRNATMSRSLLDIGASRRSSCVARVASALHLIDL